MAGIPISQLPDATTYTGAEELALTQDSTTKAGALSSFNSYFTSALGVNSIQALSGNWQDTYDIVNDRQAGWDNAEFIADELYSLHPTWISTYTTVSSNSATWADHFDSSLIASTSASWNSTYTTVNTESADWNSTYSTVLAESATWADHFDSSEIAAASADWDGTYTTVFNESGSWIGGGFDSSEIAAASGDWNSTYSTVLAESASWADHFDSSEISSASGDWTNTYSTVLAESANWADNWYVFKMGNETADADITPAEKMAWVAPADGDIHLVHSGVSLSAVGGGITIDVLKNSTSVLATSGIIAANTDSTEAGGSTPHVLTTIPTAFIQGDIISFEVVVAGGTGGGGLHTDLLISWD